LTLSSAAYQEIASVEENIILDAIAAAGAEGREVTKKDIRNAVQAERRPAHGLHTADVS
jgi:hypothetical protein